MTASTVRVGQAFRHQAPDRTPLFEIFQPFHPIHWPICGHTIGTDQAMRWDAMADGISQEELVEADAQAAFQIAKFFGLDMVRLRDNQLPPEYDARPRKTGKTSWILDGVPYQLNERTKLVELTNPGDAGSYTERETEEGTLAELEAWNGGDIGLPADSDGFFERVRDLAEADGLDWVYMAEISSGTGAAFYPPFLLMWMLNEPELFQRWLDMQMAIYLPRMQSLIAQGHTVVSFGGDVSCDKGPFISPALYREFILPAIKKNVSMIHDAGALAVYTSDGNLWDIHQDFFFQTGIDGYKEVDKAAGMTFDRLISAGIDKQVCILGNIDARHTLCLGTPDEVRSEVLQCLDYGMRSPGGHILHASHSVHEDVKSENYFAVVDTYREFFGMEKLSL